MLVDYERAWLRLKEEIVRKPAHGQRDLLTAMAVIEVESRITEGDEGFDPTPLRPRRQRRHQADSEQPRVAGRSA